MLRKIYCLSLFAVAGVLLTLSVSRAQGDFTLSVVHDGRFNDLSWQQPADFSVSYYRVYKAAIITFMPPVGPYFAIAWTTKTIYQDTLQEVNPVMLRGFQYLVTAFDVSGDSVSSNAVDCPPLFGPISMDRITINSTPPLDGTVDSLYTYQVTAVSDSTSAVLHYQLAKHPPLMVIDSTGLISWIPQASGWYGVDVAVMSSLGGEARQEFIVRVEGVAGKIAGTVTDTVGSPLPHVMVHIYRTLLPLPVMGADVLPMIPFFDYTAETDSAGNYQISHVEAGSYYVRAVPLIPNYVPEWYNNVQDLKNATRINVSDTSVQTADFRLQNRFHLLPKFAISGMVTDTLGNPVKGAWVVFARDGFVFNSAKCSQNEWNSNEDFRDFFTAAIHDKGVDHDFDLDDIHSPYVFRTYVDSNGNYSDTLPEGNYILFANAKGYYRDFFNNQMCLLAANDLELTSDTSGINFKLMSIPPIALGEISGSVVDSASGGGVPARMIAYRDIWDYRDTLRMHVAGDYFSDADSTGAYEFDNLPPGYYKILAVPLGNYAPSFYSVTGPTVRWKDATAIQIDGNMVSGANIYVMPIPDSSAGYTLINGLVANSSSRVLQAIDGAMVYSTDLNGNILGYAISDGTGNYAITGIAPGTFNVFADAVGYTSTGSIESGPSYNTDGTASPSTADLSLTPETVTAVIPPPHPTTYSLEQNYPNPFNPTTQIAFSIEQSEHVSVAVFNILGQKVATLLDGQMNSGSHIVMWDGRNQHGDAMPSGVYFYRLSTPNFTAVRKMVLLK